jgi:hypothetical protein
MRCIRWCLGGLALSIAFLGGCDSNAPRELTLEQTIKEDEKTQNAMRDYYNSLPKKGGGKGKAQRR